MKKLWLFALLGAFIIAVGMFVVAKPEFVSAENPAGNTFKIPSHAVQISEGVFSLGTARDADGRIVEGLMFIHNKKENAKPGSGRGSGSGSSTCYAYLASGAKWKTVESYLVDPSNTAGLNEQFIIDNLASDIAKWESASGANILGNKVTGTVDRANIGNLNDQNEVIFANIDGSETIAVTTIWGIFSGPTRNRVLVEWDQVYDSGFSWSSSGESGKMDFENIATHELGHAVGMGHPTGTCTEETMYAYADYGETKKRSLNAGDIAGISKLY